MANTLYSNQFDQMPVLGTLDLSTGSNEGVVSCRFYDATADAFIVAGTGVTLVDLAASDRSGAPIVGKRTADGDAIFGVRMYSTRIGDTGVDDMVEIAGQGCVVYLNSNAAIPRGSSVALVLATPGNVAVATANQTVLGVALDHAQGANELIRIKITADGIKPAATPAP